MGDSFSLKIVTKSFCKASEFANAVGVSDIAAFDQRGSNVGEENIKFPYQIYFVPNEELTQSFSTIQVGEITSSLNSIPTNTKLYDLYCQATPESEERMFVGSIVTTSKMVSSRYGDENLFFKHQRLEDDFKIENGRLPDGQAP